MYRTYRYKYAATVICHMWIHTYLYINVCLYYLDTDLVTSAFVKNSWALALPPCRSVQSHRIAILLLSMCQVRVRPHSTGTRKAGAWAVLEVNTLMMNMHASDICVSYPIIPLALVWCQVMLRCRCLILAIFCWQKKTSTSGWLPAPAGPQRLRHLRWHLNPQHDKKAGDWWVLQVSGWRDQKTRPSCKHL